MQTQELEQHMEDILKIFPGQLVLTPKQVSKMRNISTQTLRREREAGIGIGYKVRNNQYEYPVREVAKWLCSTIKTY